MANTDAEGKRGETPAADSAGNADDAGAGPPAGGMAAPPQRATDRAGWGGIDEAGIGGRSGDLRGGEDFGSETRRADD